MNQERETNEVNGPEQEYTARIEEAHKEAITEDTAREAAREAEKKQIIDGEKGIEARIGYSKYQIIDIIKLGVGIEHLPMDKQTEEALAQLPTVNCYWNRRVRVDLEAYPGSSRHLTIVPSELIHNFEINPHDMQEKGVEYIQFNRGTDESTGSVYFKLKNPINIGGVAVESVSYKDRPRLKSHRHSHEVDWEKEREVKGLSAFHPEKHY